MADYNPRGLAYRILRGGYRNAGRWKWHNMLRKTGLVLPEREWVEAGLDTWDRMWDGEDDGGELAKLIVKMRMQSDREMSKGVLMWDNRGYKDTVSEAGDAFVIKVTERGYGDVESWSVLDSVLNVLLQVFSPADVIVLLAYVDGSAATMREAAAMYNVNYNAWYNRVVRAAPQRLERDRENVLKIRE